MIDLTPAQLQVCDMQGQLFERSRELCLASSAVFVRRFMNSRVAARFDEGSALFEANTVESFMGELEMQYGPSSYGTVKYNPEALYWMGYLYRYWCSAYNWSSKRVYKVIQARELNTLYYPYHSLEPARAIERICDAKGIALPAVSGAPDAIEDVGRVAEGVELLRKIKKRHATDYFAIRL